MNRRAFTVVGELEFESEYPMVSDHIYIQGEALSTRLQEWLGEAEGQGKLGLAKVEITLFETQERANE